MPLGSVSGRVGEARFPFSSQILFSIYRPRLTASSATCSKVCGTEVKRRRIPPAQRESELTRTPKRQACELFYLCSSAFICGQYRSSAGNVKHGQPPAGKSNCASCPVPKVELVLVLLRFAEWVQAWHAAAILLDLRLFEFHLFSFGVRLTPHLAVGFREEEVRTRTGGHRPHGRLQFGDGGAGGAAAGRVHRPAGLCGVRADHGAGPQPVCDDPYHLHIVDRAFGRTVPVKWEHGVSVYGPLATTEQYLAAGG